LFKSDSKFTSVELSEIMEKHGDSAQTQCNEPAPEQATKDTGSTILVTENEEKKEQPEAAPKSEE